MTVRSVTELLDMPRTELVRLLSSGHPVSTAALRDTEYKGVSLGLPSLVDRLAWKKFKKTFVVDAGTGALRGFNVRLEQNALDAPCVPLLRDGAPIVFGHYVVKSLDGYRIPLPCRHGLMLDYSAGNNRRADPVRWVRDPIVALEPGSAHLLLGWSYLDLGLVKVRTPSFFALEIDASPASLPTKAAQVS